MEGFVGVHRNANRVAFGLHALFETANHVFEIGAQGRFGSLGEIIVNIITAKIAMKQGYLADQTQLSFLGSPPPY